MRRLDVPLTSRRLLLVPLSPALADAALTGRRPRHGLPDDLVAAVDWPTDDAAVVLTRVGLTGDASGQWLVVLRDALAQAGGGTVVGECGVRAWPHPELPEIGYGLAPSARGRGLATEAVGLLVDHLLGLPGIRGVAAEADLGNGASRRLLRRLHFRPGPDAQAAWTREP